MKVEGKERDNCLVDLKHLTSDLLGTNRLMRLLETGNRGSSASLVPFRDVFPLIRVAAGIGDRNCHFENGRSNRVRQPLLDIHSSARPPSS